MNVGAGGTTEGRAAYLAYITPTLLILTVVGAGQSIAIGAAMDAAGGIMARFKTMAISPGSVLSGQVLGTVVQSLVATALVLGAALAMGYRPDADALDWLALLGLFVLLGLALSWLCIAMGLNARSVETASNVPMILLLLPFLGSGFVPVETMPTAVRWFAEHQPFTPIIETARAARRRGGARGCAGRAGRRIVRGARRGRLRVVAVALPPRAPCLSTPPPTRGGGRQCSGERFCAARLHARDASALARRRDVVQRGSHGQLPGRRRDQAWRLRSAA